MSSGADQHTAPWPENARDLGALFQTEAQNRPTGTLRAEQAATAFQEAGLALADQRQHLGRPFGARYCWGAKSGADVAISICEYIDRSSAEKGAEQSRQASVPHREVRVNQATSLTVRRIKDDATSQAVAKRLFDEFAKL